MDGDAEPTCQSSEASLVIAFDRYHLKVSSALPIITILGQSINYGICDGKSHKKN